LDLGKLGIDYSSESVDSSIKSTKNIISKVMKGIEEEKFWVNDFKLE